MINGYRNPQWYEGVKPENTECLPKASQTLATIWDNDIVTILKLLYVFQYWINDIDGFQKITKFVN